VLEGDEGLIGPILGLGVSRKHFEVPRRSHKDGENLGEKIRRKGDNIVLRKKGNETNIVKEFQG